MLGEENKDMKIKLLDQLIEKLMDMDEGEQPESAGLAIDGEEGPGIDVSLEVPAEDDEEAKLKALSL